MVLGLYSGVLAFIVTITKKVRHPMHEDISREDKEKLFREQGIPYVANTDLNNLYSLALIKKMSSIKNECFGGYLETEQSCQECYLARLGYCQTLTKHCLTYGKDKITKDDILKVTIMGNETSDIDVHVELAKCSMQSRNTKTYKVAELILRSHNKPIHTLLEEIRQIIGEKCTTGNARSWFYQIFNRVNKYTGLELKKERITYLRIRRK